MTTSEDFTTTPLKRCSRCGNEYPATAEYFIRTRKNKDGLRGHCKQCAGSSFGVHRNRSTHGTPDGFKRCTACNEEYRADLEYFAPDKRHTDGLTSWCRNCIRAHNRENHTNDPDKMREYVRNWTAKNRERHRQRVRQYALSNPDKVRAKRQRRRARKRDLLSTFTQGEWLFCLSWWNNVCAYCGQQRDFWHTLEQEHHTPVTLGGTYTADNILPACKSCNSSKRDTPPTEWVNRKFSKKRARQILDRIALYFDSLPTTE